MNPYVIDLAEALFRMGQASDILAHLEGEHAEKALCSILEASGEVLEELWRETIEARRTPHAEPR
jgi:hypothetical protein